METLCEHLIASDGEGPYAVLSTDGMTVEYRCPDCFVMRARVLVESTTAAEVAPLVYAPLEHLDAVTLALHNERRATKGTPLSNRLNVLKQLIYKQTMPKPKPRFWNREDGGPPSHKRTKIVPCIAEPRALSGFVGIAYADPL